MIQLRFNHVLVNIYTEFCYTLHLLIRSLLDFPRILHETFQEEIFRICRRKYKDPVTIFVDFYWEPIQNLALRIIPRFITDPIEDSDKNA